MLRSTVERLGRVADLCAIQKKTAPHPNPSVYKTKIATAQHSQRVVPMPECIPSCDSSPDASLLHLQRERQGESNASIEEEEMHYASFIDALDSRGVQLDTRTPVSDLAEESVASLAHHTPDRYGPETFHAIP